MMEHVKNLETWQEGDIRFVQPWCRCGWVGQRITWDQTVVTPDPALREATRDFLSHLEEIQPYIKNPMRVVSDLVFSEDDPPPGPPWIPPTYPF